MNPKRKRQLMFISLITISAALATAFALYALKKNINLFYTPSQIAAGEAPKTRSFRVGGLVKEGSMQRMSNGLTVYFVLTDTSKTVDIKYNGILPDLFREGQGVVAQGRLNTEGIFVADQVLAKHDENYMPPPVAAALKQAKAAK